MLPTLIIVLVVLVIPVFFIAVLAISAYNKLVSLRNRYKNAYAQIDVQLKRRYDLIPNLVETAKGYLKHERGTLEAVIAAAIERVRSEPKFPPSVPDEDLVNALAQYLEFEPVE